MIGKRISKDRSLLECIYMAFEGTKTEPQYFWGLIDKKKRNLSAQFIELYKGPGARSSNLEGIVDLVSDYVLWLYENKHSVNLFVEQVLHNVELRTNKKCTIEDLKQLRHAIRHLTDGKYVTDVDRALEISVDIFGVAAAIPKRPPGGVPRREYTKFFIVADRDPGDVTIEQCEHAYDKCDKEDYRLIVSSPCFELWLLLHYDNIKKEDILKHTFPKALKHFFENETGQKSNDLDFDKYYDKIPDAKRRLKTDGYCENLKDLLSEPDCDGSICKDKFGTNMSELIDIIFKEHDTSNEC